MSKQVLIVESDSDVSREMRNALEAQGFAVDATADSKNSVDKIRKKQPDLVVLAADLSNGQSGYIVCRELKKDDALKAIPVVITGDPEKFASHRKLKTRADAYVAKPLASPTLIAAIGGLIGLPETGGKEESLSLDELVSDTGDAEEISVEANDVEATVRGDPELELLDSAFDGPGPTTEPESASAPDDDGPLAQELADAQDDETQGGDPSREDTDFSTSMAEPPELGSPEAFSRPDSLSQAAEYASRVRELEEELAGLRAELEAARSSAGGGKSDKEFFALKEAANKRDKEIIRLKGELNEKDGEIVDLKDRETALEQQLSNLQSEASQKDTQVKAATARVEQAASERRKMEQQLSAAKEEARAANNKIKALESELKESAENLESARAEKEALEAGVRRSASELEALRGELDEAKSEVEKHSAETESVRSELSEAQAKLTEQSGQLEAVQEELESARSQLADLEKAAADHEARASGLESKQAQAREVLAQAMQLLSGAGDDEVSA